jgi:hypothetical protein
VADYSIAAVAAALAVDPGDVRAVLVDVDKDPLPAWAVTDVHRALGPHGERTVPELHTPGRAQRRVVDTPVAVKSTETVDLY